MNASNVASQSSYMIDIYLISLVAFLLILLFLYIYFSSKIKKQEKFYKKKLTDITKNISNLTEQIKKEKNNTKIVPENETLSSTANAIEYSGKDQNKSKLPYTSREPVEETEGIHIDDFITFKGSRLLIVEDNLINQKILLSVLKKSGIDISVANNGQEALDLLFVEKKVFDLVLMDISMPVMDGFIATRKIRENKHFDNMPIVTFTAFAMGKEIEKMFDLGINAYLTKPLDNSQLYTIFDTYLNKQDRQISLPESIKIEGLDIEYGIALADENEELYKQTLREFLLLYVSMIDSMPKWIKEKQYDRVRFACINMGNILKSIGAYELEDIVFRMKKFFIYNTEHRIEEYQEIFPEKLEKLVNIINRYLSDNKA